MSLSADQMEQQIAHMIKFIESEADEKVSEIKVKTREEFDREVARIVKEEERKILAMYERKEKNLETQKRIAYSNKLNAARVKVLQAQDEYLQHIVSDAKAGVKTIAEDKGKYTVLLRDLITQGLCSLLETEVTLKCRSQDAKLVQEVLTDAVSAFTKATGLSCDVTVDKSNFLDDSCGGGVELSVRGNTRVTNTLDKRMDMAVSRLMPAIRFELFGASPNRAFFD
eukprot:m.51392 g.51392  ORF g.51392 m.51392 type:complete len:226 (-) comp12621_c0_seq1:430-1107(-)